VKTDHLSCCDAPGPGRRRFLVGGLITVLVVGVVGGGALAKGALRGQSSSQLLAERHAAAEGA
jgi:hypothetical protein